jgi:hypothetical protein
MSKKSYCCSAFEDAIDKNCIRREVGIHGKPEFDFYVIEAVTKRILKKKLLYSTQEVKTMDVLLYICPFCGSEL